MPSERWLQTIWGRIDWCGWKLFTSDGQSLQVLSPGIWNPNQGPDFLQAQLFIGQILWVGSIELHVRSSEWFRHCHPDDPNYQDVVLHVVWEMDRLFPALPILELSKYINQKNAARDVHPLIDIGLLACHRVMRPVDDILWQEWRWHLLSQRLIKKTAQFQSSKSHSLRRALARQLGAWVNRDVFEFIDTSIPDELFEWARADLHRITALYLGQGGFLAAAPTSSYWQYLSDLYRNIQRVNQIHPPHKQLLWMRIRPAASPMLRLAQLAYLYHTGWMDRGKWLEEDLHDLRSILRQKDRPEYWQEIFPLDLSNTKQAAFSEWVVKGLLINLWAYLNAHDVASIQDRLQRLPLEDNRITRMFALMKLTPATAADSQAMMELYHAYCSRQRCAHCCLAHCWVPDQAPQSI